MDNKRRTFLLFPPCIYPSIFYNFFMLYPGGHCTHANTLTHTYNYTHAVSLQVLSTYPTHACIVIHTHNLTPILCQLVQIVQYLNNLPIKLRIRILTKMMVRKPLLKIAKGYISYYLKFLIFTHKNCSPIAYKHRDAATGSKILTKIMARKYCSRVAKSCSLFKTKYKINFYSQNHPT